MKIILFYFVLIIVQTEVLAGRTRGTGKISHLNQKKTNEVETLLNKFIAEIDALENKAQKANEKQDQNPCSEDDPVAITESSGVIYSPGYNSSSFGVNITCRWLLNAPDGQVVRLNVKEMSLETSDNCNNDVVTIWDVQYGTNVNLGRFCGKTMPMELLKSSGQQMQVKFTSNDHYNIGRFAIQWRFVDPMPREPSDENCGRPAIKPSLKIVNGSRAVPHSWPWQVSLRILNDDNEMVHFCGGSIIATNVVLTAAHCFFVPNHDQFKPDVIRVVAGDFDTTMSADGKLQVMQIDRLIIHEDYDHSSPSQLYDIAAIILNGDLQFDTGVSTVCLPSEPPSIQSLCYSTGWGDTKNTGKDTVLNQVRLPVVSQTNCSSMEYYGCMLKDTMMCAGYDQGGEDSCQGDSGGPFVCLNEVNNRWYLQGITSFGIGCGAPEKPGVYTRVLMYLDWISNQTSISV